MSKKIAALVGTIGLVVGGLGGYVLAPQDVVTETITEQVIVEQPVEVEVVKEVLVDNENLSEVLEFLHDNDGDVQFLTSDLTDSEVDEIVDRVLFVNEAKAIALNSTRSSFFDEINNRIYNSVEFDSDDLERLRIDEDFEDIRVLSTDFDFNDAKIRLTGTFEQDDVEYDFTVDVLVKDGQFEDFENIVIN